MSDRTMSYNGYCGSIEVSLEDNCLFGKILFINDLVNYEASGPIELETAFHEALHDYLAKCAKDGLQPNKSCSGTFNVRVSPDLHRNASIKAACIGVTLNDFVKECIANGVSEQKTILTINQNHEHHHYAEVVPDERYEEENSQLWTQTPKAPTKRQAKEKLVKH